MSSQLEPGPFVRRFIRVAFESRWALLLIWSTAIVAAVAWQMTRPWYVAQSILQPTAADVSSLGRLTGLAAQFGIAVPTGGGSKSVDFFSRLATSREILESVALSDYHLEGTDSTSTLVAILNFGGDDDDRLRKSVDWLRDNAQSTIDVTAGLLTLRTRAHQERLAEQINNRLLEELQVYNEETVQSLASAERVFLDERLEEVRGDLAASESRLGQFYRENRTYQTSPELMLEAARLNRAVDLQQQLLLSLAQARNQAGIEEVRNTPVVSLVESPVGSARATGFGKRLSLAITVAILFGVALCLYRSLPKEHRSITHWLEEVAASTNSHASN